MLNIDRSDRRVHEALALVYRDMKEYESSVEALNHAIELEPEYPDNYFNRGQSLYLAEAYEAAIEDYDQAPTPRPKPQSPNLLAWLGGEAWHDGRLGL